MMTFEEVIHRALKADPSSKWGDTTDLCYYDELENGIYGYSLSYGRDYCDVYIEIGANIYPIKKNGISLLTKEELIEIYREQKERNGEEK